MRCKSCHGPAVSFKTRHGKRRVFCLFCGARYDLAERHPHVEAQELIPEGWAPIL